MSEPVVSYQGEQALLIDSGKPFSLVDQRKFWAFNDVVATMPCVIECVLGMCNLLVRVDIDPVHLPDFQARLIDAYNECTPRDTVGAHVTVPVTYGGRFGPDLKDFAAAAGLSVSDVVDLHTSCELVVCTIGSSPGFGYLGGLPEVLHRPRKAVPVLFAEAGSVMIGGDQAGVTSAGGPTGWHVLGRSQLKMFDLSQSPPARLAPGDIVTFTAVGIEDD